VADPPYGGAVYLADTSAWAWRERLAESEWEEFDAAVRAQQVAYCPAVLHELGQGAQTAERLDDLYKEFSALRRLAITDSEWRAAQSAIRRLSQAVPMAGYHRGIAVTDVLVAVTAERFGLGVLHYDEDFDRLAAPGIIEFESRPVAPLGSL
jgi:predicted nucleic acid-binding protein